MKSDIRVCRDHDRPVYTLSSTCPECGADAENSAPAPFNPEDPYGEYRRALKRRVRD
ncbi:RNA-protein complex protein Nop10 [Salarchaeum japonicum]|uniref:Ribosome biogenesis protein Nop10 n=1 Tax=Salarchaeum japonicum TaxID=555573 RepID=A0AAV3T3A2_9EURY|nr:RNA-protein complex protein Nop10 [Salarchaeum japonicum]